MWRIPGAENKDDSRGFRWAGSQALVLKMSDHRVELVYGPARNCLARWAFSGSTRDSAAHEHATCMHCIEEGGN